MSDKMPKQRLIGMALIAKAKREEKEKWMALIQRLLLLMIVNNLCWLAALVLIVLTLS